MATESSVVVALKEVRRLEIDRQRREEDARRVAQEEEERAQNDERASVQYGPGMAPFNTNGWEGNGHGQGSDNGSYGRVHRTSEVVPLQTNGHASYMQPQSYVSQAPPSWEGPDFASDRQQKSKSSFRAVVLTLLFCGGAAGAGWWKLTQDFNARLIASETGLIRAEDARKQAVIERSKLEQELKVKNTEFEAKLAAAAKTSAASNAAALAARAAAPTAAAPLPGAGRISRGFRRGRGFGRSHALAAKAAPIAAPKPAAVAPKAVAAPVGPSPKLAKKKMATDDPLGGLKL